LFLKFARDFIFGKRTLRFAARTRRLPLPLQIALSAARCFGDFPPGNGRCWGPPAVEGSRDGGADATVEFSRGVTAGRSSRVARG